MLILISLVPHFFLTWLLFLKNPPIWPDESIYMDTALTLVKTGQLATSIFNGAIIGLEKYAAWYPPLYFYVLSFWIATFGSSIEIMRLLSVLFSLGSLILIYKIAKNIFESTRLAILSILMITVDYWFSLSSRVGRMDSLAFFLLVSTFYFFLRANKDKHQTNYLVAGTIAGLSVINHPLGLIAPVVIIIYLFIVQPSFKEKFFSALNFLLPVGIMLLIWYINMGNFFDLFVEQYKLQFARKAVMTPYAKFLFDSDIWWKILFIIYFIVLLIAIRQILIIRRKKDLLLAVGFVVSTLVLLWGKELWYTLYFQPFATLMLISIINTNDSKTGNKTLFMFAIFSIFFFFAVNLSKLSTDIQGKKIGDSDYHAFSKLISDKIANNSAVFLSVIPDPYFDLRQRKDLTLFEFPTVPVTREAYIKILNSADYVVVNQIFNPIVSQYIKDNAAGYDKILESGGYGAIVVKLKPRQKRQKNEE